MIKTDKLQISYFGEASIQAWEDDTFEVAAFIDVQSLRLTIGRKDGADGIGWDDLQRIKNDCGFEDKDAVEFYPRASDVINTQNLRHLYVLPAPISLIRRKG